MLTPGTIQFQQATQLCVGEDEIGEMDPIT